MTTLALLPIVVTFGLIGALVALELSAPSRRVRRIPLPRRGDWSLRSVLRSFGSRPERTGVTHGK